MRSYNLLQTLVEISKTTATGVLKKSYIREVYKFTLFITGAKSMYMLAKNSHNIFVYK